MVEQAREKQRVVVTGVATAIGQRVAELLVRDGHEVFGIDRRPLGAGAASGVEHFEVDIRKRAAEEVLRKVRPDVVVHMATVSHLTTRRGEERFRINLGGTRSVFEHARAHGSPRVVFVGRHTYYGAAPDSPLYHAESEPPLALSTFPELADLVAADLYAGTALWRFPEINTTILRVVYTLGPSGQGTLAGFLRGRRVPLALGFDPLFQFMHDDDAAAAIALAAVTGPRGVFNVAGPTPVPLSVLVRATGRSPLPLPASVLPTMLGRFGLPKLPRGAVAHLKFPVVIDGAAFRAATGFTHRFDEADTMVAFAKSNPTPRDR